MADTLTDMTNAKYRIHGISMAKKNQYKKRRGTCRLSNKGLDGEPVQCPKCEVIFRTKKKKEIECPVCGNVYQITKPTK